MLNCELKSWRISPDHIILRNVRLLISVYEEKVAPKLKSKKRIRKICLKMDLRKMH